MEATRSTPARPDIGLSSFRERDGPDLDEEGLVGGIFLFMQPPFVSAMKIPANRLTWLLAGCRETRGILMRTTDLCKRLSVYGVAKRIE